MCRELTIIELEMLSFYCYLMVKGVLSVGWLFSLRFGTGERRRSWASSVRLFTCNATRVFYYVLRRYERPNNFGIPPWARAARPSVLLCVPAARPFGLAVLSCLREAAETHASECKLSVRGEPVWRTRHQHQKKSHLNKLQIAARSERESPRKRLVFQVARLGHVL